MFRTIRLHHLYPLWMGAEVRLSEPGSPNTSALISVPPILYIRSQVPEWCRIVVLAGHPLPLWVISDRRLLLAPTQPNLAFLRSAQTTSSCKIKPVQQAWTYYRLQLLSYFPMEMTPCIKWIHMFQISKRNQMDIKDGHQALDFYGLSLSLIYRIANFILSTSSIIIAAPPHPIMNVWPNHTMCFPC